MLTCIVFKKNFWKRGWPSSHRVSATPANHSPNPHRTIGSAEQKNKIDQYQMFDVQLQSLFDDRDEKQDSKTTMINKTELDSKTSSSQGSDAISVNRSQSAPYNADFHTHDWDVELGYPRGGIRVDTIVEVSSDSDAPTPAVSQPAPAVVRSPPNRPEDLCLLPSISEGSYGSYSSPAEVEAARKASIT